MGQVTVSIVLLVASFLFLRNLARTHVMNPGFDTSRSLVAQVSFVEHRYTAETRLALLRAAVERVEALPGIERATFALGMPLTICHGRTSGSLIWVESEGKEKAFQAHWAENMIGPGYFDTLGIPLRQGRDFTRSDDASAPDVVIVNEAFVRRYFGTRSPVGLRLMLPGLKDEPAVRGRRHRRQQQAPHARRGPDGGDLFQLSAAAELVPASRT